MNQNNITITTPHCPNPPAFSPPPPYPPPLTTTHNPPHHFLFCPQKHWCYIFLTHVPRTGTTVRHCRQSADSFWFGTFCSYACVSIAAMDRHFTLISLLTIGAVYPVMTFSFLCFIILPSFVLLWSLLGTVWTHGRTGLLYLHWTLLSLQLDESTIHAIHTWHFFIAATVDVSLHTHAMCQTSLLIVLVLFLKKQVSRLYYQSHFLLDQVINSVSKK